MKEKHLVYFVHIKVFGRYSVLDRLPCTDLDGNEVIPLFILF